jgi:hypothetical protein
MAENAESISLSLRGLPGATVRQRVPLKNRKVEVKRGAALSPFRHDERD